MLLRPGSWHPGREALRAYCEQQGVGVAVFGGAPIRTRPTGWTRPTWPSARRAGSWCTATGSFLDGVRDVVLDEADEMLGMGFLEDVEGSSRRRPKGARPPSSRRPSRRDPADRRALLHNPMGIEVRAKTIRSPPSSRLRRCRAARSSESLVRVLKRSDPSGDHLRPDQERGRRLAGGSGARLRAGRCTAT